MVVRLGTSLITQRTPHTFRIGGSNIDRIYDGTKLVWESGQQLADGLDSLSGFTQTSTGSGVVSTSSEAAWTGGTDGQATLLYNTSAMTNNQYASCVVGSVVTNTRASGLILHCDASLSSWYGLLIEGDRLTILSNTGRWMQNIGGAYDVAYGEWAGTVKYLDTVEFWNIGQNFYAAHNGTIRVTATIPSPNIGPSQRRVGFGMYRSSFVSSSRLAHWWGGDAGAWGKI